MKTYKNIYYKIYKWENLFLAFLKAKKGKSKKLYVKQFEKNLTENLQELQFELMTKTYKPKPLSTFILRDPKTRKISVSDFRDRIIHHALCNIIEPIFQKTFIHDSCANQKGKGNIFAIKRFEKFLRKVTRNGKQKGWFNFDQVKGYCLKADIKHYFQEVKHKILLDIIKRKIRDRDAIELIIKIMKNNSNKNEGMPLGNLTSQFFANIYLNELDYFIKHNLKIKYYLRYVDDFVILHQDKESLIHIKEQLREFLGKKLELELHQDKSRIIKLSRGVNFVGFRIFYNKKLLRKRNIRKMQEKINQYRANIISKNKFNSILQGWSAYSKWAKIHQLNFNMQNLMHYLYKQYNHIIS